MAKWDSELNSAEPVPEFQSEYPIGIFLRNTWVSITYLSQSWDARRA